MPATPTAVKIDFVSDVVCPWCAVGLRALEVAIERLTDQVRTTLHLQPFELNPDMPPGGQDIVEHLTQKYRITPEQIAANSETISRRGAEVGFTFRMDRRTRTYNSFDAHRLLHWADSEDKSIALKHALLRAYFAEGRNIGDHMTLAQLAGEVGMSQERAAAILASAEFADDVRARERHFVEMGIHAVPSVILNERHLIQGGQPPETFERAIRHVASQG